MAPISDSGTGTFNVSEKEVVHLVDLVTKDKWDLQFGDDYLHLVGTQTLHILRNMTHTSIVEGFSAYSESKECCLKRVVMSFVQPRLYCKSRKFLR